MSTEAASVPAVRYEVKGEEIDISKLNRFMRRLLEKTGKTQAKKFAKYVHPETGERPDVVISIPDPGKPSVQARLVTDSPDLREWLKSQGIVIGEVVVDQD